MTLKEIAAKAGVSISTVSRIINSPDDSFARKEVRDRVWRIIEETGYTPNQSARELKRGKLSSDKTDCGSIVFISGNSDAGENPFLSQLKRSVEQQALEQGFPVRLSLFASQIKDGSIFKKTDTVKSDGAVVIGRIDKNSITILERHYKYIVYAGCSEANAEWDQVICDGYEAAKTAVEYLISKGHRRIGYIGRTDDEVRYRAYIDALTSFSISPDYSLVSSTENNSDGGYCGAKRLIKEASSLPTAVFCAADTAAIAALRCFTEEKIHVPQQISLISIDNIELSGYVSPMLTTVGIPAVEMGYMAVKILIDRINRGHRLPVRIYLPSTLAVRESVADISW